MRLAIPGWLRRRRRLSCEATRGVWPQAGGVPAQALTRHQTPLVPAGHRQLEASCLCHPNTSLREMSSGWLRRRRRLSCEATRGVWPQAGGVPAQALTRHQTPLVPAGHRQFEASCLCHPNTSLREMSSGWLRRRRRLSCEATRGPGTQAALLSSQVVTRHQTPLVPAGHRQLEASCLCHPKTRIATQLSSLLADWFAGLLNGPVSLNTTPKFGQCFTLRFTFDHR